MRRIMIKGVKRIELPKFKDIRGNLTFFENNNQIPFQIKRSYWIYDVPIGEKREGHSFKKSQEFIVALSGSFNIVLNDGKNKFKYHLNSSNDGIYVPNLIWRSLDDFSTNSLVLIVSNNKYDSEDHITNFKEFITLINEN